MAFSWRKNNMGSLLVACQRKVLSYTVKTNSTIYIEYDGTGIPMTRQELIGRNGKQSDGSAKTREVKLGCLGERLLFSTLKV
jgi:hypothetical protein